jgi:hypothetical protein
MYFGDLLISAHGHFPHIFHCYRASHCVVWSYVDLPYYCP